MSMMLAHAVDEAFERMTRLYGRDFVTKFETDIDDVKAQWMRELATISNVLDAIAWALKNLPERAPNAIQFRNLCRQAPSPQQAAMPFGSGGPVRGPTEDELATFGALRGRIDAGDFGQRTGREWAFELLAKHERGEDVGGYALRCAREVAEMRAAPVDFVPRETEKPSQASPWEDFYDEEQRP